MRKRKIIIALSVVLILVSGFICKDIAGSINNEDAILTFLEESDAVIEESMLTGWNIINEKFMDQQEISLKFDEIISVFGFNEENIIKEFETHEDMNKGILSIKEDGSKYTITIESFRNKDQGEKTYLSLIVVFNGFYKNLFEHRNYMEEFYAKVDLPIELDIVVIGNFAGKVTKELAESTINKLLNTIDANEVESIKNQELISISAYSRKIDDFITSNGNKINVQIGMRYSQYYDKTYIWIGSPIIPFEY
ncbi:YwmB family TATA-box binding protein [Lutispora sp.]|uniref:YwmB family TATA-box binding protein n=1 Tax=Lutispora sp. TaxID=2828727 RepID=UPI0035650B40